jgi:hypothetical protein
MTYSAYRRRPWPREGLGNGVTWADWVRLVATEVNVYGLTDEEIDWLLWERTPWPLGDHRHIRPCLLDALQGVQGCPCCGGTMTAEEDARDGVCGPCAAEW